MKICFHFVTIPLLLCFLHHETKAGVVPENIKIKLHFFKEQSLGFDYQLFYKGAKELYKRYQKGPCGKFMWIDREFPDSTNGICRCVQTPLGLRPLIFWPPTNRCYFSYDQGPCDSHQWLIQNSETNKVECQPNPCPTSKLEKNTNNDLGSLLELETDYYFVDNRDNSSCLRKRLDIRSVHFDGRRPEVARFVLNNETQRFFPMGERGPCPPLMEIPLQYNETIKYGECNCKHLGPGHRPIVYWRKTNRCYFAFTQGPCKSDEWIVGYGKRAVTCQKHKCPITPPVNKEDDEIDQMLKPDRQFFVQDSNGTCYETNTTAFCSGHKKLYVTQTFDGFAPQCFDINSNNGEPILDGAYGGVTVTGNQNCHETYTWDERGKCVKVIEFDETVF